MRLFDYSSCPVILFLIILLPSSCIRVQPFGTSIDIPGDTLSCAVPGVCELLSDSNQKAESYYQIGQLYEKNKKQKEAVNMYLKALRLMPTDDSLVSDICDQLSACYADRDSMLNPVDRSQINAIIICSLTGLALILLVFMYINNRNKRKYIGLQLQLMKNQSDKQQQKNELKSLINTHQHIEKENREMQDKLTDLWGQTIQICARLFQTTSSYKKLMILETTRVKKEREKTQEELHAIHEEINEVFATALQELSEMSSGLTPDDLLFCVLNYLNLSGATIKICMRVESAQALTQRKYRIKKQLDPSIFAFVFGSPVVRETNMNLE